MPPALALGLSSLVLAADGGVVTWPAPPGAELSTDYRVTVNGQAVPVHACRVSAMPFNQVWPGYQRPLDQTEPAAFASWDMAGPVTVEVTSARAIEQVAVRPTARGIKPLVKGDRIAFTLDQPGPVVVEVNGWHGALHLFANPPEEGAPAPDAPGVRYFGPGIHRPGKIVLKDGETVYLAGGAIVYGSIQAQGARNLRIAGRGILDQGPYERGFGGAVRLSDCTDVSLEGIVMRDPDVWCLSLFGCRNVRVANVKLVGLWRYNADGIDVCNSQDVVVEDCFVRAFDDALVVKGLKSAYDARPVRHVRFRRCVIWCDWGRAMEIGAETCAPTIRDLRFEDSDIIRTTHIALDIQHGDRAEVSDVRFERIRVEIDPWNPPPRLQTSREDVYRPDPQSTYCPSLLVIVIRGTNYSKDQVRGTVRDVVFRDIAVTGKMQPASSFRGFDADHTVAGVTISGLTFNGRPATTPAEAKLAVAEHVADVRFMDAADPLAAAARWLEDRSTAMIRDSRREMHDGTAAFPPQVGAHYNAFWLRDYAYLVEGNPAAFSTRELTDACRTFVRAMREDGAGVDCVKYDGTPILKPGMGRMGENPVADGSPFTIDVAWRTWRETRDLELVREILDRLVLCLRATPRSPDHGLVFIDPAKEWDRCPYGFTDTVRKTGEELFCSLLFHRACGQLAELLEAGGRAAEAAGWRAEADRAAQSIREVFWQPELGLFRAATVRCNQPDLWGSAFAVHLGVATPEQARAVATYLRDHYAEVVQRGQLRHLPGAMYWDNQRLDEDKYQNGGFWGTPTGWLVDTLDRVDPALADRTVLDLVADYRARGVWENVCGERLYVADYNASAALPLAGIRAMLARRAREGR